MSRTTQGWTPLIPSKASVAGRLMTSRGRARRSTDLSIRTRTPRKLFASVPGPAEPRNGDKPAVGAPTSSITVQLKLDRIFWLTRERPVHHLGYMHEIAHIDTS